MSRLEITSDSGDAWVRPGDRLSATARWDLVDEVEALEVRLFWYTSGKGARDVEIVDQRRIAAPERHGSRGFTFTIPAGPVSFSGSLVTLAWAVELVALPSEDSARLDLLVGWQPVEVDLRTRREW